MMKKLLFFGLMWAILAAAPLTSLAASYPVGDGVKLFLEEPSSPWKVSPRPPAFLVRERAEHLHPPQLEAARKAGINDPEDVARKLLSINELFAFNAETGSHIEIDFSALKDGEDPPTEKVVKTSASYAGEGLSSEDGITGAQTEVRRFPIAGAEISYRLDAEYKLHGKPVRFIGVIGFAARHWFFIYYTGPGKSADDVAVVEKLLASCRIEAP